MKAGLGVSQVNDELNALATRIAQRTPETNKGVQLIAKPVNQQFNGRITDAVWIAFISVGGLLVLIACSNVANLLLARSVQRSREIAIRVSMGATRWRIVRQLLVEGMLLAAIGGLLGLGLSFLGLRILTSATPAGGLPFWVSFTMDGRVFGVLAAVCLGTVLLFALAPAVHIARTDVNELLKEAGRTSSGGTRARRWTAALLAAQFGITVILLSSVNLSVRRFRAAERAAVVVNAPQLLTMSVTLPPEKYASPEQRLALYSALRERLSVIESVSETRDRERAAVRGTLESACGVREACDVRRCPPAQRDRRVDWSPIFRHRRRPALSRPIVRGPRRHTRSADGDRQPAVCVALLCSRRSDRPANRVRT